jgi:hypothetical protein
MEMISCYSFLFSTINYIHRKEEALSIGEGKQQIVQCHVYLDSREN